jgi:hypothetical protein
MELIHPPDRIVGLRNILSLCRPKHRILERQNQCQIVDIQIKILLVQVQIIGQLTIVQGHKHIDLLRTMNVHMDICLSILTISLRQVCFRKVSVLLQDLLL